MAEIALGVLGTFALYKAFGENNATRNNMGTMQTTPAPAGPGTNGEQQIVSSQKQNLDNEYASVEGIEGRKPFQSCVDQQGAWISSSLLPKSDGKLTNEWNVNTPGNLEQKNFLEAGYHFGIDTVGSSNKNANLQLRSEPVIPRKTNVSPFLNSSILPEDHRRRFEIQEF